MPSLKPQLQERLTVERDGEELEVFNWVNITQHSTVRGHNPLVQTDAVEIGAGDASFSPDAVTAWVADELRDEFQVDPEDHGIEVVDVESDEVNVL
ncbi:hypothetical protein A6E15_19290 [Natrinema saccharevitans]|uniref:Uncharacterized protein n=1 Tax=Natrinema saccharevitans TaxID=301967 RepID=A0A1S8AR21_9EURY|nr:hypothetical protein [Natrinema saccharevitans]OLZ39110.1 hypothetical protein A6E15_19290 [Natrinema saccharevitans]